MRRVLSDYINEIREIWSEIGANSTSNTVHKSVNYLNEIREIYNTLAIGENFIFIINHQSGLFDYVSPNTESILGYKSNEFTVELSVKSIHPEDIDDVISIQQQIYTINENIVPEERLNYKFNYDFRMNHVNGKIKQIHVQHFFFDHDDKFLPINFFCLATDISQIKIGGTPTLKIFNIKNGLNTILNEKIEGIILTKKEKEVFSFLIKGFTSQDIAYALKISKHTVDTHRRNILKKNNCTNIIELFSCFLGNKIASR